MNITLFRSITMFFVGLTILSGIFLTFNLNGGILYRFLLVLENIVIDLNNVMKG